MARSVIPDFGIEYPEWKYRPFPRYVGLDEQGEALIADSEEEARRLKELAAYPKVLGKDKAGNEVIAQNPRDEQWFAGRVVKQAAENALTDEAPKQRLGRPPNSSKTEAA